MKAGDGGNAGRKEEENEGWGENTVTCVPQPLKFQAEALEAERNG